MTLDKQRYLRDNWLNLVDKMIGELYTIDEHSWINATLIC